jgi:hypothetical protein
MFIRSQERMVYQTVMDYLESNMASLGWMATDVETLPFGATAPITWMETTPDPKLGPIVANSIAFSEGDVPDDTDLEMGANLGGLWSVDHTFFIDIYGESQGVAQALSSDLRAILTGRLPGTARYQPLMDYSVVPAVAAAGHLLHFEDVEITRPVAQPSKLRWEVVKATAVHEFNAAAS